MAANNLPAASSQTKPNNQGGLTAVPVLPPRKITYLFNATSAKNLSIPYAVAVGGVVLPAYAKKAKRVSGDNGKITVTVVQGQRVSLYLNSDAQPEWRTQAVYAVTAGERDMLITMYASAKHTLTTSARRARDIRREATSDAAAAR